MLNTKNKHKQQPDTTQVRHAFLQASYRGLFGTAPDEKALTQLIRENRGNGR